MTDKSAITVEINVVVGSNFHAWRIGLTNDPAWCKRHWKDNHHEDLSRWQQWQADSLDDAKAIELTFTSNGMRPTSEQEQEVVSDVFPVYVYIF